MGEKVETCHISYSWVPELMWTVTAVTKLKDFCSLKKNYNKPRQHIKKQRHHFADTKVHIVKALVFPVVVYGCESWTINKAEC